MSAQTYLNVMIISLIIIIVVAFLLGYPILKKKYKTDIPLTEMFKIENTLKSFMLENKLDQYSNKIMEKLDKFFNMKEIEENDKETYASQGDEKETMLISFKRGLTDEQKLFEKAHEYGHGILKDSFPVTRPSGHGKSLNEQRADYLGAAILLPYEVVLAFLIKTDYIEFSKEDRNNCILEFANQKTLEKEVVLRRVSEVKLLLKNGYKIDYNFLLKEFNNANELFNKLEKLKAKL